MKSLSTAVRFTESTSHRAWLCCFCCCLGICLLFLLAGCVTPPPAFTPRALPTEVEWQGVSKRQVYVELLKAVHLAGLQIDPSGTSEDGNLVTTLLQDLTWQDNPSVMTRVRYSTSYLVTDGVDGVSVLINYHYSTGNSGWGDWSDVVQRHIYQRYDPEISRVMGHLEQSLGQPRVKSSRILVP